MKKRMGTGLIVVMLIIFLVSSGMVVNKAFEYRQGQQTYDDAQQLAGMENYESETPETIETTAIPEEILKTLKEIDLEDLQEKNKDVFGWILIPGADISYPLVDGEDNTYYLTHTWDKKWNYMGSIFLEQECKADLSDFNTIIYGHNMKDKTMFSNLKKYMDEDFLDTAPYIYISTEESVRRYDIFSAYEVAVNGHAFWIHVKDEDYKQKFIDNSIEMSEVRISVVPQITDHIITLSTCTGNGHEKRMVVQAVLTGEE